MIPFLSFTGTNKAIKGELLSAFEKFIDSQYYVLGESVSAFENKYAEYNEVAYCIGVGSGMDALHIALRALNIGPGDEVIVPSNTYIATVLAVSCVGATPVFVEPDIDTYNLNPDLLEEAITATTKVIIPVHLYGQACQMDKIMQIAHAHRIQVLEDNAQAHGATYQGKRTGSFGIINATSFYPGKNLGALGEAGAITTDDQQLAQSCAMLRNYGSAQKYYNEVKGMNARLDEMQAAVLSIKLKYLDQWTNERIKLASLYHKLLAGVGDIILPHILPEATCVYHLFVLRTQQREALQAYLQQNGINTMIHYPVPPHLQKAYQELGYKRGDFPVSEEIASTCLSLPLYVGLQEQQVEYICEKIKNFY